ncbi:ER protein Pkr1-domain-containing protein [Xylogone sp. PMI_703]|nr:ER protein Pkr1-domain-containing protein [Xylogone sp. PMI_703]
MSSPLATFFNDLFQSIFTPGPTPSLLIATNVSFACLQIVLFILLVATYSVHFVVLSIISGGLWWGINWFVAEVNAFKASQEELAKRAQETAAAVNDDTETEVESITHTTGREEETHRSKDVEVMEASELKERRSMAGSRSGISTEDEWEQVSENEKDK